MNRRLEVHKTTMQGCGDAERQGNNHGKCTETNDLVYFSFAVTLPLCIPASPLFTLDIKSIL